MTGNANWNGYVNLQLPMFETGEAAKGDPTRAMKALKLLNSQRQARLEKLQVLLAPLGIKLDGGYESLKKLNMFFSENVEEQEGASFASYGWAEVIVDIGVYIGETLIRKYPELALEWSIFNLDGEGEMHYLDIVITFSGPGEDGVVVYDPFEGLVSYAWEVLNDDLFLEELKWINFPLLMAQYDLHIAGIDHNIFNTYETLALANRVLSKRITEPGFDFFS